MGDHEIIAQLERATPDELKRLLRSPSLPQARVYKTYFGKDRYDRLRRQVLSHKRRGSRGRAKKRGNAVVLHGIMGGELALRKSGQRIWVHPWRLALGGLGWLRMDEHGKSLYPMLPAGILMKWYVELLLGLSDEWDVHAYWYDWRLDLNETADDLRRRIDGWFGSEAPVNLIAHSMGGLVSRTYIHQHPKRWNKGGKLIMIGTPNHGAFSIPRVLTGTESTVRKLALLDTKHNLGEVTTILGRFPGVLQMLPSPLVMPTMDPLYQSKTWDNRVPQGLLDRARQHHDTLANVADGERMHYIAGDGHWTFNDIKSWSKMAIDTDGHQGGYRSDKNGDGTVPHRLGILEDGGTPIPTWFVHEEHGALPNSKSVVRATQQLLVEDSCELATKAGVAQPTTRSSAAAQQQARQAEALAEEEHLESIRERLLVGGGRAIDDDDDDKDILTKDDVAATELILRGFLSTSAGPVSGMPLKGRSARRPKARSALEIALVWGGIQDEFAKDKLPVDAISIGHYIGVAPQNAELAIDRAISGWKEGDGDETLIITGFHRRRAIGGQLGHQFTLTDTRNAKRLVVLAGMGMPGQFTDIELSVLTRELAWMLSHTGREHLASVLIGAGIGNLVVEDAVHAWLRGLDRGLSDAQANGRPVLKKLTFVEYTAENFIRLDQALREAATRPCNLEDDAMSVSYKPQSERVITKAKKEGQKRAAARWLANLNKTSAAKDSEPVRLSIRLEQDDYEFSALTAEASIPQRRVTVDPVLIEQINAKLPVADDADEQYRLGRLFGTMLVPDDLREAIVPDVPVVLAVDANTARLHFEMTALEVDQKHEGFDPKAFLGTSVSLTRQLRTELVSVPEPQITSSRRLKVLIVTDPSAEASLPGAQEEGEAVAALFERLQEQGYPVDVKCLFGPADATRVAVLGELVNERYDVLHYAGHCYFDEKDAPQSGWLFSNKEVLTARELRRVLQVPRFVFSNACESGITPEREDGRLALLAPSFAEAFFECGVANFVCTAWPVDDLAALRFAETLYKGLLGFLPDEPKPLPLHKAMRIAREEVATNCGPGGLSTWGAYQHYGDPNGRLLTALPDNPPPTRRRKRASTRKSRSVPKKRSSPTPRRAKKRTRS